MLREMSKRKRGLGSWVIAYICCLTPDTKAERRFITHMEKDVRKKRGVTKKKEDLTPQLSSPNSCQNNLRNKIFKKYIRTL